MAIKDEANLFVEIDGQLHEIKRQLRQPSGYPFYLGDLKSHLQAAIEGQFNLAAFRETGELAGVKIVIPALPRPTIRKLRKEFPWIREEDGLELNASPTGPVMLQLGTVLRPDELSINGVEYAHRLVNLPALGYPQGQWLVNHQDDPELATFKALATGEYYIDLPTTIVVDGDGDRLFVYLDGVGGRWYLYWYDADDGLYRIGRLALGK